MIDCDIESDELDKSYRDVQVRFSDLSKPTLKTPGGPIKSGRAIRRSEDDDDSDDDDDYDDESELPAENVNAASAEIKAAIKFKLLRNLYRNYLGIEMQFDKFMGSKSSSSFLYGESYMNR